MHIMKKLLMNFTFFATKLTHTLVSLLHKLVDIPFSVMYIQCVEKMVSVSLSVSGECT